LKKFESELWFYYSLHCLMALFHDIVEVFDLRDDNVEASLSLMI